VIMYILLSGKPPFEGKDDKEILKKVKKGEIYVNTIEWRKRSKECIDLIKKMMNKDPEKRISA
jgi:calcium-dependent protein kinase